MASSQTETNGAAESKANGNGLIIPDWVNEDNFTDLLKQNVPEFLKILHFDAAITGGAGENYGSVLLRVKTKAEIKGPIKCLCCSGAATRDIAFMLKTLPQSEQSAHIVNTMGLFPKELVMYSKYIPEFEQMYLNAGQKVTFAPKFYTLPKNPGREYVLLEDLGACGFKNANRIEGLDKEHSESILKLLAQFHAASAVRFETKGPYVPSIMENMFSEEKRALLDAMWKPVQSVFEECLEKYKTGKKFLGKVKELHNQYIDTLINLGTFDPNNFNVLNHGDIWCNNIMFRYDDQGKREETVFIDYQGPRYGSPTIDLFQFLLSTPKLELKITHFDYFIKFYHDHLVENLTLLQYPKKIPSLKELHVELLTQSFWAFTTLIGVLPAVLLEPTKDANMDNYINEGVEAKKFRIQVYSNPRYVEQVEIILPWLDARGLLE